jgi:molybdopterin synthase catalytic subunit
LLEVRISHRIGFVPVGDASLLVRVGSRHRAGAFEAGEWIVDQLKKRVPIWKQPRFEQLPSQVAARSSVAGNAHRTPV